METSENESGSSPAREKMPQEKHVPKDNKTADESTQKDPMIKKLWARTGLTLPMILMMIKAAIPPTVSTAMYQADAVATEFSTLGYLVSIASILGFPIMPRAKFIQTMFTNILAICLGSALALLGIYSATQARKHTTPPGQSLVGYNSSAAAVCGIWLAFQIYIINALRSALPQLQFPTILYSIFVDIAMVYGAQFPTMSVGIAFVVRLMKCFLSGFGLATATHFLIFPTNTRQIVFKEMNGYLNCLKGSWRTQSAYIEAFEHTNLFAKPASSSGSEQTHFPKNQDRHDSARQDPSAPAKALPKAVAALVEVHGKLHGDLAFAKREIAFGKLDGTHIGKIVQLLKMVFLPTLGLGAMTSIFDRVAVFQMWDELDIPDNFETAASYEASKRSFHEWQNIMGVINKPYKNLVGAMEEAIDHVLIVLELKKPAKKGQSDLESSGGVPQPGESKFARHLEIRLNQFYEERLMPLRTWCQQKGVELPTNSFETSVEWPDGYANPNGSQRERDQRQIFLVLYMEYLLSSASKNLLELVRYVDSKVEDKTLANKRLLLPPFRRLKKWLKGLFSESDTSNADHRLMAEMDSYDVHLGAAFGSRKDPEHLPPVNAFQKFGNLIRVIPRTLRSPHSVFGFRAVCATMTIAIIAYLRPSQQFFSQQRFVWALIMVAFSMARTSGQSLFNFIFRIVGTAIAMIASFVVWYIVDGKTPGVIVFQFIWLSIAFGWILTQPRYVVVGMISAITVVLIVGYELQVIKVGLKVSESNGQNFYPVYLLAPFRLATVSGGLFVAYFWTIFPFPITEHGELRKNVAGATYLLANFYSIIHETVLTRARGEEINMNDKNSPGRRLEKARLDVFSKAQMQISQLHTSSELMRWQINIGGRYPKETYDEIIACLSRLLNASALISYASTTFTHTTTEEQTPWKRDFKKLLTAVNPTSHEITSRFALLSSSLASGHPVPPYLCSLEPFRLLKRMQAMDRNILDIRNLAEPEYAAFAVVQIASRSLVADLNKLTDLVKKLVGELDFSFHIVSTSQSAKASQDTLVPNDAKNGKGD